MGLGGEMARLTVVGCAKAESPRPVNRDSMQTTRSRFIVSSLSRQALRRENLPEIQPIARPRKIAEGFTSRPECTTRRRKRDRDRKLPVTAR